MSAALRVPFVDLSHSNRLVHDDVLADVDGLAEGSSFIGGPIVRRFEYEWADYCDADYCVGVSSGLDALRISLQASDLLVDSSVVVPALTFVATWEAVTQAGMTLLPVDVDEDGLLDVDACPIGAQAVVPVHLYGRLAAVERLRDRRRGLVVIEDAAHAHGLLRAPGGTAAFSFYPSKNLGAWGDAGAIVTDDSDLADRARALRDHGRISQTNHAAVGWTARLDAIQAAVLLEKLSYLDDWNAQRAHAAWLYSEMLADISELRLPTAAEHHVWHIYEIRTADRDALADALHAAQIGTHVHYPTPPHLTGAYRYLGYGYERGDFPVAERIANETLSLPLFPGITEQQQLHVATEIRRHFE